MNNSIKVNLADMDVPTESVFKYPNQLPTRGFAVTLPPGYYFDLVYNDPRAHGIKAVVVHAASGAKTYVETGTYILEYGDEAAHKQLASSIEFAAMEHAYQNRKEVSNE